MKRHSYVIAIAIMLAACSVQAQSWSSAQLLNDASEAGQDVKSAKVVAARNGGFHAIYAAGQVRYKRCINGVLKSRQSMPINNFWANGQLCETPDGKIHVAIEDWVYDAPEVRWYRYDVNDATGQLFNGVTSIISTSYHTAKDPYIAPFGDNGDIVMSYARFGKAAGDTENQLFWARLDGSAWTPDTAVGSWANSEYEVHGMGRSPLDGTVYRTFTENGSLRMRRFRSGGWWDPELVIDNVIRNGNDMHNRQRVAVNSAGQVMVLWDQDSKYWSALYTPGSGVAPAVMVTDRGSWGNSLCAIPGTNTFYTIYSRDSSHMVGRRWANGAWGAEEEVSVGLPWDFMVGPDVSAAADGTLYAVYEFWGSGKPQQYYSIKAAPAAGATGTVSGFVRDQFGQGVGGIGINSSGTGATFTASDGSYVLKLAPGTYTLTAAKEFFAGQTVANVVVNQNQSVAINFTVSTSAPASVTGFSAKSGSTLNMLQWTNPTNVNLSGTRIIAKLGGYPTGPNDGVVVIDDVGAPGSTRTCTHAGLTNGLAWYYAAYAYMKEGNRYYASAPTASATPSTKPDMDHDGDVDQEDYGLFQLCQSGAYINQTAPQCQQAKLDGDTDVDSDDAAVFLQCMSGANVYANTSCGG